MFSSFLYPCMIFIYCSCMSLATNLVKPWAQKYHLEIAVMDDNFKNLDENDGVFVDTGKKDKDRFMLFTRESHLDVLENSKAVGADGTFKVKKKFFRQIFTIHGEINGKMVPLVFVLMKTKTKNAYRKVFKFLKSKRVRHFS